MCFLTYKNHINIQEIITKLRRDSELKAENCIMR